MKSESIQGWYKEVIEEFKGMIAMCVRPTCTQEFHISNKLRIEIWIDNDNYNFEAAKRARDDTTNFLFKHFEIISLNIYLHISN